MATLSKCLKSVMVALVSMFAISAFGAEISSIYGSFQPSRVFGKGEGEGYALSYKVRKKEDLISILRGSSTDTTRVACELIVRQLVELHTELPFEGCEGAAAAIEMASEFEVVECGVDIYTYAVTNKDGSEFGKWNRPCLPEEKLLTYKGMPIISLTCLNPIFPLQIEVRKKLPTAPEIPLAARTPPADPVFNREIKQQCDMVVTPRVYKNKAGKVDGVREILTSVDESGGRFVEGATDGSTDGDGSEAGRISRLYGSVLHTMFKDGELGLSTSSYHISIALERRGDAARVFFDGEVTGEKRVKLPADFTDGDVIVTRFYDYGPIMSPSMHGLHSWYAEFQRCGTNVQSMIER